MQIQTTPVALAEMLIRRPVSEVFEAFVNPELTRQFWFTKSSGRLEADKQLRWDWEMYGKSAQVNVKIIDKNKRILIEWGTGDPDSATTAEWIFTPRSDESTFVSTKESGFGGSGDDIVQRALASTQGFTLVLAGAKALLEHRVRLNLIADRFPDNIVSGWRAQ
ncbi:MAG TPA: SRPBCC family protein [Steroidobacteraceae bacterium]|nr:SRPBCC family protein [Steroidobacteraceae bacterium]